MRYLASLMVMTALLTGPGLAQDDFPAVRVAEEVALSVVSIDANQVAYGGVTGGGALEAARFSRLLTNRITGMVYTENGYILTDERGIQDAVLLNVIFNDGTELEAKVVGSDPDYGVAVLKVDSEKPLKPAKMVTERYDGINDVYPYQQGDAVIAVGYSGGLGGTVTYGIISAVRNFRNRNEILLPSVIQSDVSINAGNEGCPLFNEAGAAVGFHDRVGDGMENTTFFTPMWIIARAADEIIANYESERPSDDFQVWHPWLGIKTFSGSINPFTGRPREVDPGLKMFLNVPDEYWDVGILIDSIWPESPAREFGLLAHDMLMDVIVLDHNEDVKVEYQLLESIEDLELLVTTADRDDVFVFGVLRFGTGDVTYLTREVVIGQHPGAFSSVAVSSGGLFIEMSSDYF